MDGGREGRMDGLVGGWREGRMDGWISRWIDRWREGGRDICISADEGRDRGRQAGVRYECNYCIPV